jgi:two-component system, OmpR family, response regulator
MTSSQSTHAVPITVLIVDDEPQIRSLIMSYLEMQGMSVHEADSSAALRQKMTQHHIDIILLDVNLGAEDGFTLARQLRQSNSWHGGIIMLTGRVDTVDRVVGLEIGADDYVAKPFELRELLARVRSVARRTMRTESSDQAHQAFRLQFANYLMDEAARSVVRLNDSVSIDLTTGEFNLLCALVHNAQRVMNRDQLLQKISGRSATGVYDRTIDVQIGRLRKKLDDSSGESLIKSLRNAGYMLAVKKI